MSTSDFEGVVGHTPFNLHQDIELTIWVFPKIMVPQNGWLKISWIFHGPSFQRMFVYMGVSKNRSIPKWMVYFMENPIINMDDLGVNTIIFGNTHMSIWPFWPLTK